MRDIRLLKRRMFFGRRCQAAACLEFKNKQKRELRDALLFGPVKERQ